LPARLQSILKNSDAHASHITAARFEGSRRSRTLWDSRRFRVAVVTFGAGAFNLVNAITGAYAERSPVVVIAGAPGAGERISGFVLHHQARSVDTQMAIYREITCDQAVLTNALTAPNEIARVLRSARERSLVKLDASPTART
jgi:thiamine pyrophosphate-dependent acetolactate synthase large subunit-like protein